MNKAEVRNLLREQIYQGKGQGKDISHLQLRLIELDKQTRVNKKPRITTP